MMFKNNWRIQPVASLVAIGVSSVACLTLAALSYGGELIEVKVAANEDGPNLRKMILRQEGREQIIYVHEGSIITTADVEKIADSDNPLVLWVELSEAGKAKMVAGTKDLERVPLAIIVKGDVHNAPILIRVPLGGTFQIGNFKDAKAANAHVEEFDEMKNKAGGSGK